jgi:hypothetical protein
MSSARFTNDSRNLAGRKSDRPLRPAGAGAERRLHLPHSPTRWGESLRASLYCANQIQNPAPRRIQNPCHRHN